jgi:hypothetical protein
MARLPGGEAAERKVMLATYKGFRRNSDGSWTCIAESTIESPTGRMQAMPRMTFHPGVKYMGADVAALLDTLARAKSVKI